MATRCIDYLNLPSFNQKPTESGVLNGDYAFMEYAVLCWIRHLEAGLVDGEDHLDLMRQLSESLEIFISIHWKAPNVAFEISKRNRAKLEVFRLMPCYDKLEQTLASTRKQLTNFGDMDNDAIALNLVDLVRDVREILELLASPSLKTVTHEIIEQKYGSNLFRCPRFSCQFFTTGFHTANERDKHVGKHDRPFRCHDESCTGFVIGFSTLGQREKHMKETHDIHRIYDQEFPTDQDVQQSIHHNAVEEQGIAESSASETDDQQRHHPSQKQSTREFQCQHCPRVFTKRYNLESHLSTHKNDRHHICEYCGTPFSRRSDLKRHIGTHEDTKRFVCSGILQNGEHWGCGKSFSRSDILANHHKSKIGRECRRPLLEEQQRAFHRGKNCEGSLN